MKKVFTFDTVMASLIGAIGYGAGYVIPASMGCNALISLIICTVVGSVCDKAADKIIFNSAVQKTAARKYTVFAGIILIFCLAYYLMDKFFAHSLWSDLGTELLFLIGIPVAAFFVSIGIRYIKQIKLSKKYGSGEGGFKIDQEAADALKALVGDNQEITDYEGKDPAIKTTGGLYVGKRDKTGVGYLGIPYATAERWKKPSPVQASDKTYEAFYFGNSEIQPESSHNVLTNVKQDEDCLNLNIWVSGTEVNAKKPVLVYFHGGDGRYGGSANPVYHLGNISKAVPDAVFVSVNYRLGVFGVVDFSSTGCPDADEYSDSTSLSLLDQIEALKWIKANIAAFGGDPENITVAGDSSGGSCITLLAAMKEAKGLFKRAIVMCASTSDIPVDKERASDVGKKLFEEFGAKSIYDLNKVTSEQLREFENRHYDILELPPRDGKYVPLDINKAYLDGVASDVEFIFGIAADDASAWEAMTAGDMSLEEMVGAYYDSLKGALSETKADDLEDLLQKYIGAGLDATAAKKALLADFHYKASILWDCMSLEKGGSKVRCFYWDVKGNIEKLTANAISMVTAVLGNADIAEQMGYLHDAGLTEIMKSFVGKFVKGSEMELYNNELKGVSEIVWDTYNDDKGGILHVQKDTIKMSTDVFTDNVFELVKLR